MRLIKALLLLVFVVSGALFGALNRDPVRVELGFFSLETSLGISLLLAVLAGALLAGAVLAAGVIWPMRLRMRRGTTTGNDHSPAERHD